MGVGGGGVGRGSKVKGHLHTLNIIRSEPGKRPLPKEAFQIWLKVEYHVFTWKQSLISVILGKRGRMMEKSR